MLATAPELTVLVTNEGAFESIGADATVTLPAGFSATSTPSSCLAGVERIICTLDGIEANESLPLVFALTATEAGSSAAQVSISASNDQDLTNNTAFVVTLVAEAMGGETGGTDGATTGTVGTSNDADSGTAEWAILLTLLLAVSARLNWLNQRKLIVLRK